MFQKLFLSSLFLFCALVVFAQKDEVNFTGKITDAAEAPLQGANVWLAELRRGGASDKNGKFEVPDVPPGVYSVEVSFVGYKKLTKTISITGEASRFTENFSLEKQVTDLSVLTVKSTRVDLQSPFTFINLSKEAIEKNNLGLDVPFLLQWTPSAVVTSDAGNGIGYTGIRIRGSDPTRINVTINGIPLNDAESQNVFWVDLPDFASSTADIQIQRGVGTSTNGAGAFGATINLNTAQLEAEPYAELSASAGSFGTYRGNLQFGSGLLANKFTLDGRISKINSDGFIDRGSADLFSWFASAAYLGAKTSIRLNAFSGKERTYQAWCGVPAQLLDERRTFNPCGLKSDGTYYENQVDDYLQTHLQSVFNQQLSKNLFLNLALHYTIGEGYFEEWRESEDLSFYGVGDTAVFGNLARRRWLDNDYYGSVFSLNFISNSTKLEATIGGGWHRYEGLHFGKAIWTTLTGSEVPDFNYYENEAEKTDLNLYAKINYRLTRRLKGFLDLQTRKVDYTLEDLTDAVVSAQYNFFNPKGGLTFEFSPKSSLYASLAVANREPNRDDFRNSSAQNRPRPEKLTDLEIGYRTGWKKAALEVNYFYMNYTDQLALNGKINEDGAYARVNIPESYRTGLEITGGWQLIEKLRLDGNLAASLNRVKAFSEFVDVYNDDFGDYLGQDEITHTNTELAFSPNLVGALGLTYDLLKKEKHRVTANLSGKYVGRQYLDNTGNDHSALDPYFFSDLRLEYDLKTNKTELLKFTLLVQNLFNAKFITNGWIYRYRALDFDPTAGDNFSRAEGETYYSQAGFFPQAGINFLAGVKIRI